MCFRLLNCRPYRNIQFGSDLAATLTRAGREIEVGGHFGRWGIVKTFYCSVCNEIGSCVLYVYVTEKNRVSLTVSDSTLASEFGPLEKWGGAYWMNRLYSML